MRLDSPTTPGSAGTAKRLAAAAITAACAAGLCLMLAAGGCVRKPQLSLKDIQVRGITFTTIDLTCFFEVTNPNIFDAKLKNFDYSISAVGEKIAAGAVPQPIPKVPAGGSEIIPVAVSIDFAKLGRVVRKRRQAEPVSYRLACRAVFDIIGFGIPVPFDHRGQLPALQAPRWELKDVTVRGGEKPAFLLTFQVANPNAMDLSLEGFNGALKLSDETVLEVDETTVTELPGRQKAEITVPVRLGVAGAYKAARKAMSGRRKLKFEGKFKLKAPVSLRKMLLGKATVK